MKTHDGCVYRGLRYSAYLRGVSPNAEVTLIRNDAEDTNKVQYSVLLQTILQNDPFKVFGITIGHTTRSLSEIVELAITKLRNYDAILETFSVEESQTED